MRNGGVIGYPTEAVWGLGCDPYSELAVEKLLQLKQRSRAKGLILVAANMAQVRPLLSHLSASQIDLLNNSWPGPTTWLIEDSQNLLPQWIKGQYSSVAVRVSQHKAVVALCEAFDGLVVSTSLNPAGSDPALSEAQSRTYFSSAVDVYVRGETGGLMQPSQIRNLTTGEILR